MSENAIQAYQGQTFRIALRTNGGTNYAWCLTTMPQDAVALAIKTYEQVSNQPGAPVDEVFTFFALKGGSVKIGFKHLCWSKPEETANEVFFDVVVIPHNEEGGLDGFIRYNANSASYVVPPYGYNAAVSASADPSIMKYGYPGCDTIDAHARLFYGYYGCPQNVVQKYGYPGCEASLVFKYGFPGCDDPIPVKYGFPGCEESAPAQAYTGIQKYGYPGCDAVGAQARFYYGFPGHPRPIVKYGFPGCE